jgi:AcrR family transcriptional regulator
MPPLRTPGNVSLSDHIARVAANLFYREGFHVVGVDRVAAKAEVTKRTLYRYYPSKDDLIAAALRRGARIAFPKEGPPRERILGAFDGLIELIRTPSYHGCPYINAAAELTNRNHPGRVVVEQLTARRRRWFADRVSELGVADPDVLAEQLDVLFDGALANAMKRVIDTPAIAARAAAVVLLDAALASAGGHKRGRSRPRPSQTAPASANAAISSATPATTSASRYRPVRNDTEVATSGPAI